MSDLISRQAAIDAIEQMQIPIMRSAIEYEQFIFKGMSEALNAVKDLPSAQPEDCDTCKHGYFGDDQCERCRVRYPSHYERRTDGEIIPE